MSASNTEVVTEVTDIGILAQRKYMKEQEEMRMQESKGVKKNKKPQKRLRRKSTRNQIRENFKKEVVSSVRRY